MKGGSQIIAYSDKQEPCHNAPDAWALHTPFSLSPNERNTVSLLISGVIIFLIKARTREVLPLQETHLTHQSVKMVALTASTWRHFRSYQTGRKGSPSHIRARFASLSIFSVSNPLLFVCFLFGGQPSLKCSLSSF
jgi:hypothetical protein